MKALRQAIARNPLAAAALAAIAGILLMEQAYTPSLQSLSFWVSLGFAGWACWRPSSLWLAAAIISGFAFIHGNRLEATRFHPLFTLLQTGETVEVVASGHFLRASMTPESLEAPGRHETRFEADKIEISSLAKTITGATELRVWVKNTTFIPAGNRYELRGSLSLVAPSANPSLYDRQLGAQRQGIVAEMKARFVNAEGPPQISLRLALLTIAERCRQWIEGALSLGLENDDAPRILIQTMALGTNEPGSASLQEPFRNSGTLHVFAVSGLHVSMLAMIGWTLLRPLGLGRKRALLILIPMIVGYAFITGWRPSAARAAMMSCAMLCAPLVDRRSRPINALGACALLILADDTQQLFQAGFQLSFGVVWGIAACTRLLTKPLDKFAQLDPFLPQALATTWQRFSVWSRREMIAIAVVSLVATAASFPIMLLEFHSVTPVGIVANCVLVPLAFVSLLTVVLSLVSAGIHSSAAQLLFNNANWFFVKAMTASAAWFAAWPGGNFSVPIGMEPKLAAATLSVLSLPPGEGAQMLESNGQHWLLDVGSGASESLAMLPFLRYEGVNHLDGIILSHADAAHIGATVDLIRRFNPPLLMTSVHEPWRLDSGVTAMRRVFGKHLADASMAVKLRDGDTIPVGQTKIHILYPTPSDIFNKADDRAIVARIDCGKMRVLWCNDAGFIAEKLMLSRHSRADLASHVIVRNQHSSDVSALPDFLEAVDPKLIVSSNSVGFAAQRIPQRLQTYCTTHGIALFDETETGMVKLELWQDHLTAKTWVTGASMTIQP